MVLFLDVPEIEIIPPSGLGSSKNGMYGLLNRGKDRKNGPLEVALFRPPWNLKGYYKEVKKNKGKKDGNFSFLRLDEGHENLNRLKKN